MSDTSGLAVTGIAKAYGTTKALRNANLNAPRGEITGIAGPNGAGKSTLVGILGGEFSADGGTILLNGKFVDQKELWSRVAVVHQEPQLFPNLSVWENVLAGQEGTSIAWPRANETVRSLLIDFDLWKVRGAELGSIPIAAQQRVEIVRALVRSVEVLIFDEPNSALSEAESAELFRTMHKLSEEGRVILLVTHRIGELVQHCSSVAVILDGATHAVLEGDGLTEQRIAAELVAHSSTRPAHGRTASTASVPSTPHRTIVVHMAGERSAALEIRSGEVLALVGVEGSGARDFAQHLARTGERSKAVIDWQGDNSSGRGIEFVPAHRRHSLFFNFSVTENVTSRLSRDITGPLGLLSVRKIGDIARAARARMSIKVGGLDEPVGTLSGGNQQKVAIAAAIEPQPAMIVLEEPTRGVDLGSRAEIYEILRTYAREGRLVVLYCTEVTEVFAAADRAIVFRDGRPVADLTAGAFDDIEGLSAAIVEAEWSDAASQAADS
jgi:ABC-type sugar transport system ATPase subunit